LQVEAVGSTPGKPCEWPGNMGDFAADGVLCLVSVPRESANEALPDCVVRGCTFTVWGDRNKNGDRKERTDMVSVAGGEGFR